MGATFHHFLLVTVLRATPYYLRAFARQRTSSACTRRARCCYVFSPRCGTSVCFARSISSCLRAPFKRCARLSAPHRSLRAHLPLRTIALAAHTTSLHYLPPLHSRALCRFPHLTTSAATSSPCHSAHSSSYSSFHLAYLRLPHRVRAVRAPRTSPLRFWHHLPAARAHGAYSCRHACAHPLTRGLGWDHTMPRAAWSGSFCRQ